MCFFEGNKLGRRRSAFFSNTLNRYFIWYSTVPGGWIIRHDLLELIAVIAAATVAEDDASAAGGGENPDITRGIGS